jgi:hypothetical protein
MSKMRNGSEGEEYVKTKERNRRRRNSGYRQFKNDIESIMNEEFLEIDNVSVLGE